MQTEYEDNVRKQCSRRHPVIQRKGQRESATKPQLLNYNFCLTDPEKNTYQTE